MDNAAKGEGRGCPVSESSFILKSGKKRKKEKENWTSRWTFDAFETRRGKIRGETRIEMLHADVKIHNIMFR